jgi:hypothetical protein
MIIETIFSTLGPAGEANFAPMGVIWGEETLIVRPFRSTQTCSNLLASGYGVANLSDDVLAFVQTALQGKVLPHFPARKAPGVVYRQACSWLELEVITDSGDEQRAEIACRVIHRERQRDFLGFCRAKGAVLEAAILATRLDRTPPEAAAAAINGYAQIVEKTGGPQELAALHLVQSFIRSFHDDP